MSNLYERPLALVPQPQQLKLTAGAWQPVRRWKFFDAPRGRAWAFAADARRARRLLARAPRLQERKPEAYALTTFPDGAVAVAHDVAGLLHSRTTLKQLLTLAGDGSLPLVEIQDWPDLAVRGIHLDLKYMMHRKDYLLRWLEDLAFTKINTVLLEYEDKFPYRKHPVLRHPAAFTEEALEQFLARARSLGLRVVPLIQTLGHVEYILKHERFAHLRQGGFHTEYDTLHPETWSFIRAMLDEVLEWHGPDEWFHVGGDECWHLMQRPPAERLKLYGGHMRKVIQHVARAGKRPLVWDDMLRGFLNAVPAMKRSLFRYIPRETIICYWGYAGTHHPKIPQRGEGLKPSKGGSVGKWARFRKAGYDVIGVPCHDWGPGVPYYADHTVTNTLEKIRDTVHNNGLGIINSHWASFHVPLPLQEYGIALTAERSWRVSDGTLTLRDFDEAWCRLRLGASDRTFVDALYQLGDGMLEMPTKAKLGRPIHLPYYYYMDSVLHYPNAHEDRLRYGPVSPPSEVDYARIVRMKLQHLSDNPVRDASLIGLKRIRDHANSATRLLHGIKTNVRRSRDLFELVAWFAEFRSHAARRMLAMATGANRAQRGAVLRELRILRQKMRRVFRRFMDDGEFRLEETSLFDGEETVLRES